MLVDTQFDLPMTRTLKAAVVSAVPGVAVTTVVTTHANGDHCWGNQVFADAEIIGSAASAHEMAHEIQPAQLAALSGPGSPDTPLGHYVRRHFGHFDFPGIVVTPPARTFTGSLEVPVGARSVELIEVGPAHTDGDVIVHVPDAAVVFAGDILFIGDHPIMWSGPAENWIAACDRILATGARHVVPGHGPVTDPAGVRMGTAAAQRLNALTDVSAWRSVPGRESAFLQFGQRTPAPGPFPGAPPVQGGAIDGTEFSASFSAPARDRDRCRGARRAGRLDPHVRPGRDDDAVRRDRRQ